MPPPPAPTSLTRSRAFRQAALRSEVHRAYAVLVSAGLMLGLTLVPDSSGGLVPSVRIIAALGLGLLVALQLGLLAFARWARVRDRAIPTWFIVSSIIIESLIPGGIILSHILRATYPPYSALLTPPILAYGVMISLSTLRLRPALCILAGSLSAASYGALVVYVAYGLDNPGTITLPTTGLPYAVYINAPLIIFISGLAAAWVAREIRRHVHAALSEAETRHQVARLEHDLSIARSIQRALLPRAAPDIRGYDVAGWNRSADQTGGDYYDWQKLPDGNWMVTLADVSGHGIGPALVTAACRAYVRATSFYNGDLAALTGRMNRLLADDLPDGRFVTMVSVIIEPSAGPGSAVTPLRLLSAGHGPIVIYAGATGSVNEIMPGGLPLAVMPDSEFGPAESVHLAPGDLLALVTDGFVEWARRGSTSSSRGEQFGMERLADSLRKNAHLPSIKIIEAVAADVAAFAGDEPQQDDLTMVIIKRIAD
ncbi:MAG: PP2C family protein-serine/threonine phosphatase [Phycisphaerales bacterium]